MFMIRFAYVDSERKKIKGHGKNIAHWQEKSADVSCKDITQNIKHDTKPI